MASTQIDLEKIFAAAPEPAQDYKAEKFVELEHFVSLEVTTEPSSTTIGYQNQT